VAEQVFVALADPTRRAILAAPAGARMPRLPGGTSCASGAQAGLPPSAGQMICAYVWSKPLLGVKLIS
jgi:hypothetical protein